jgi:hypothetical protein
MAASTSKEGSTHKVRNIREYGFTFPGIFKWRKEQALFEVNIHSFKVKK